MNSCNLSKVKKRWQIWTAASSQSETKAALEPADEARATLLSTQGPCSGPYWSLQTGQKLTIDPQPSCTGNCISNLKEDEKKNNSDFTSCEHQYSAFIFHTYTHSNDAEAKIDHTQNVRTHWGPTVLRRTFEGQFAPHHASWKHARHFVLRHDTLARPDPRVTRYGWLAASTCELAHSRPADGEKKKRQPAKRLVFQSFSQSKNLWKWCSRRETPRHMHIKLLRIYRYCSSLPLLLISHITKHFKMPADCTSSPAEFLSWTSDSLLTMESHLPFWKKKGGLPLLSTGKLQLPQPVVSLPW